MDTCSTLLNIPLKLEGKGPSRIGPFSFFVVKRKPPARLVDKELIDMDKKGTPVYIRVKVCQPNKKIQEDFQNERH